MSQKCFILSLLLIFSSFSNTCSARQRCKVKSVVKGLSYTVGGGAAGIGIGFVAGAGIGMATAPAKSGPLPLYMGFLGAFYGLIVGAIWGAVSSFTPESEVVRDYKIKQQPLLRGQRDKHNHVENTQSDR